MPVNRDKIKNMFYGDVRKKFGHPSITSISDVIPEQKTKLELLEEDRNNKRTEYQKAFKNRYNIPKEELYEKQTAYDIAAERLSEATLNKYPGLVNTANFTGNGYSSNIQYLINNHIRENNKEAKSIYNYYKSYNNSEGIQRIFNNQLNNTPDSILTRKNIIKQQQSLIDYRNNKQKQKINIFDLDGYPETSLYNKAYNTGLIYKHDTDESDNKAEHPYLYTIGHEIGHHLDNTNGINNYFLNINKGYEKNNHDELYYERMADLWSLRYLLYNTGIYDSRKNKDATKEDVEKLRKLYPNIRPFKQMKSNDDVAKLLNLVAENKYSTPLKGDNTRRTLANGGGIYIKPSHRGRLTELKARTGKTESELYNDGNPAHKKMVVFARNARKWNH